MSDNDAVSHRAGFRAPMLGRTRDRAILSVCRTATRGLQHGRLRLTLPSGESALLGGPREDATPAVDAAVTLENFKVFHKSIGRGSIGFAEAYLAGDIKTPDLGQVFRFYLANYDALQAAGRGQFKVRLRDKLWHKLRDNTRAGSRRNITAHYDLGNAFYAPWLDPSMTYSGAIYALANETLEAAQARKLDAIVAALELQPGLRVLEIGCGWGALAERIARAGCHVTAITVSQAQLTFANRRIAGAGLADRVDVQFCDYRDMTGQFDRIVSIEMIEAVGEAHWPAFFRTLHDRLASDGHAVIQAITIREDRFAGYRAKADFIQRFIFPGGMLPTQRIMAEQGTDAGLDFVTLQTFGTSYAATLVAWRDRFEAAWPALSRLGFDERFKRMWIYYLTYCEVGFETGATDVGLYRYGRTA